MVLYPLNQDLYNTLHHHSICNSLESGDVSACYEVLTEVVLSASFLCDLEDVNHDVLELIVYPLLVPDEVLSVLCHLEARASNSTGVSSLGRSNYTAVLHEVLNSLVSCRHVGTFNEISGTVSNHFLSPIHGDIVLHSAWHVQISLNFPRSLAGDKLSVRELLYVRSANILAGVT